MEMTLSTGCTYLVAFRSVVRATLTDTEVPKIQINHNFLNFNCRPSLSSMKRYMYAALTCTILSQIF